MNSSTRDTGTLRQARRRPPDLPWRAALVLACALLWGCAGGCRRINPEGPPQMPPPARPHVPVLSTLSVPVGIPVEEVSALVNQVVPQRLYQARDLKLKKGILSARLNLEVQRNGSVYTRTRNGRVISYLPLRAEGEVRVPPGISRPFSTTFTVHAVADVGLDENWATHARIRSGFFWETKPTLSVLGIKIDVSKTAGKALTRELEKLTPQITRIIEEKVNVRKQAEDVWERLRVPLSLQKTPPVWLTIEPVAAFFSDGVSHADTLLFGLTVHAYLETVVGLEPEAPALGALPPLLPLPDSLAADTAYAFHINLPVSLSYADARRLLSTSLVDKNYDVQDGVAVTVGDIDLYGHFSQLVARVDFKARVSDSWLGTRGRVFLTGKPVYDAETQTVRVDSFDYDVHSKNALAEAADLIYRDTLLVQTRERLVFQLADDIETARVLLQEALRDRPIGKHLVLDGHVADLQPGALYLTPDGIHVDISARGRLTVRLRNLEQIRRSPPG